MHFIPINRVIELIQALRPEVSVEAVTELVAPYAELPLEPSEQGSGTPRLSYSRFVQLLLDHKVLDPLDATLPVFLNWLTGFSHQVALTYVGLQLMNTSTIRRLMDEIAGALKTGVHARRQALEIALAELAEHQDNMRRESDELLGRPVNPLPGDWAPLGRFLHSFMNPDFAWDNFPETISCRFMTLRLDTVTGNVLLGDGDGRPMSVEFLEEACRRAKGTGRNPFLLLQQQQTQQEAVNTQQEAPSLILDAQGKPAGTVTAG